MSVKKEHFGEMPDGREVSLYTITNKNGLEASVTDLGAVWVRMVVPDKKGVMDDVMLGFDDAAGYLNNGPHFGSVVGRIANRTAKGKFSLNGKEYTLAVNNGPNNLHSGLDYYDARLWNAKEEAENAVTFTLLSPDGDQGYPGNAIVSVTYTLTDEDMKKINEIEDAASVGSNPFIMAGRMTNATADAMQTAAGNDAGAMTGFMGMGMVGMGGQGGFGAAQNIYAAGVAQAQQDQQNQPAQQSVDAWKCSCGATSTGKFCPECGAARPEANGWTCSCGTVNQGKFCQNCGAKKPEGC